MAQQDVNHGTVAGDGTGDILFLAFKAVDENFDELFVQNALNITHIADSTIHFTQAAISITESQISDLGSYLPLAGGTMTGNITLADHVSAINSGDYTVQMTSGVSDTAGNIGFSFNAPVFANAGTIPAPVDFTIGHNFKIGSDIVMQTRWSNLIGLGGASMAHFPVFVTFGDAGGVLQGFAGAPFIEAEYDLTSGTVFSFTANATTGLGGIPVALEGVSNVKDNATTSRPTTFKGTISQQSLNPFNQAGSFVGGDDPAVFKSQLKSTSSTGKLGYISGFMAIEPSFASGTPVEASAFTAMNQGVGGMTAAYGLIVKNQSGATNNYGIVLEGDGVGSDIVFGAAQDAGIWYDNTNLVIDPKLVGSGYLDVLSDIHADSFVMNTQQAYTLNATSVLDRTLLASASATTTNNNNVLAALITDLQTAGLIA